MELSKLQREIVEANDSKIVVLSAAASGKTETMKERVNFLLNKGVEATGIVMITFTNLAAEEMRERVGEKGRDMFIGTVHSYANYLLSRIGVNTSNYREEEKFDVFFSLVKENPKCIAPVEHLLLDEAQDSTTEQFEFILKMIKPKNYFLVGDLRQSIFGFSGSNCEFLRRLTCQPDVKCFSLNENYRNAPEILKFAKNIIKKNGEVDDSIAMRDTTRGIIRQGSFSMPEIMRLLRKQSSYGKWAILCRSNAQIEFFCDALKKQGIPHDTFRKSQLTAKQLQELMKKNSIKVLTSHSSKGLEFDNVIVYGSLWRSEEEIRLNYVSATRARNVLIWVNRPKNKTKMAF